MEIKEAIKIINQYDMNFHWDYGEPIPAEQLAEAFDLAISALEKEHADGCQGCAFTDVEEWEMPCAKCKRACKDYWRPAKDERM
jgi:hypothetical protein